MSSPSTISPTRTSRRSGIGMGGMMSSVTTRRLDLGRRLHSPRVGVATSKTGHQGWLGGSRLDHSVVGVSERHGF
jgi:hypothetical protein